MTKDSITSGTFDSTILQREKLIAIVVSKEETCGRYERELCICIAADSNRI